MSDETSSKKPTNKGAGLFSIEAASIYKALQLDGINPAVAYIVIASGTTGMGISSSWSCNAVETYTGISRSRAKSAVKQLLDVGLIKNVGKQSHPRYELKLQSKKDPELIWLPQTFVTGVNDEQAPLERLRQTQDPMTLRLMLDCYKEQNLVENYGVSHTAFYENFKRYDFGQKAQYSLWAFNKISTTAYPQHPIIKPHMDFELAEDEQATNLWPRINSLERLGLLEQVLCVFESEHRDAEIVYSISVGDSGHEVERLLGQYALRLGDLMVREHERETADSGAFVILPVPSNYTKTILRGIYRPKYRAKTKMTAAWSAELNNMKELAERFRQAVDQIEISQDPQLATSR